MRLAQLESQLAKIKSSTITDVQPELRRLGYNIGEIDERFDETACTSVTLDYLRATVDRHEVELLGLQRQGELVLSGVLHRKVSPLV